MANYISSTSSTPSPASPSTPAPTSTPLITPSLPSVTKTIITSTLQFITTTDSDGSLLRDGAGVAINAVYIAMFIILGVCILLCIVSSACWCFMKHRQDNRFNNFMEKEQEL